jgi:ubiquinone/menaquinone biosynthesis C-methylase UbiE
MIAFLRTRRREAEWLDDPDADPALVQKSLVFIKWVNRVLGYTRVIVRKLDDFSAQWKRGQTIRVLDVGTGAADIPLAILRWADERGLKVQVVGLDINPVIARVAARAANDPRLSIVRGDAMNLPFANGSFDYAITSMFLHHLDDAGAERTLAEMGRVAKGGVVVSDLLRMYHAYWAIWLLTLFSNPMVKHDARVSVAQAFNRMEILALRNRAGLRFARYSTPIRHRFVLSGERDGAGQGKLMRDD